MKTNTLRWAVVALALLLALSTVPLVGAQSDQRCFPETGYCISGPIRTPASTP